MQTISAGKKTWCRCNFIVYGTLLYQASKTVRKVAARENTRTYRPEEAQFLN